MRYFTDEESDIKGYLEQLKALRSRFKEDVYLFLSTDSFHDAHIYSIKVKNSFNPEAEQEEEDPTLVEAHLLHSSGAEYKMRWLGVNKILMDYDSQRNTYVDSEEIAFEGKRGLDDWISDEISAYDETYLFHEIILASDTTLNIRFRGIDIEKI